MIKKFLIGLYASAMNLNDRNVERALADAGPCESLLDVGCWDAAKTVGYARAAGASRVCGIEAVAEQARIARERGVETHSVWADREPWPFPDASFDRVVSNQVIEHLSDIDFFIAEAYRVLRPGGVLVTSTNNLSSWHNIIALLFGWAPFDLTNSSARAAGIGNPLALHRGDFSGLGSTWTHKTILTSRWMNDWFALYGFSPIRTYGAGYYPLPSSVGRAFRTHAAFVTLANRKQS